MNITTQTTTIITIIVSFLDDFFAFLRKEEALIAYVKAFENQSCDPAGKLKTLRTAKEPSSWFSSAFVWASTPQGHDYWSQLNDKWHACLKEQKDKAQADVCGYSKIEWKAAE